MSDRNTTTSQLAALDLGSNSFHLLIALEDRGRIQVIDKYKEMVRLGEGLTSTNHLDPVVERRAIQCLERMSERLRSVDSGSVRVVGTNTLRRLSKNNQFVALAEQVLGHPIEIISGREEARLIYWAFPMTSVIIPGVSWSSISVGEVRNLSLVRISRHRPSRACTWAVCP